MPNQADWSVFSCGWGDSLQVFVTVWYSHCLTYLTYLYSTKNPCSPSLAFKEEHITRKWLSHAFSEIWQYQFCIISFYCKALWATSSVCEVLDEYKVYYIILYYIFMSVLSKNPEQGNLQRIFLRTTLQQNLIECRPKWLLFLLLRDKICKSLRPDCQQINNCQVSKLVAGW